MQTTICSQVVTTLRPGEKVTVHTRNNVYTLEAVDGSRQFHLYVPLDPRPHLARLMSADPVIKVHHPISLFVQDWARHHDIVPATNFTRITP